MHLTQSGFTPGSALAGGVLIGLGLAGVLVGGGRIAGVSGVLGGLVRAPRGELSWRLFFLVGMLVAGLTFAVGRPGDFDDASALRPLPLLALAGLLVGLGTSVGRGCTSGHGICGMSRLSVRSIFATLTFMATGIATAVVADALGRR
jgi:uncharacterized membrane protein YedE/YeeE